jgi:hypothetical protein
MADKFVSRAKVVGQLVISLMLLAAGLYVILSGKYSAVAEGWAAGAIGTVLGYWLR